MALSTRYGIVSAECGTGGADFWSISCGSGFNGSSTIIQVAPCGFDNFTVYIKVKALDSSGAPRKTGASPSPYFFSKAEIADSGARKYSRVHRSPATNSVLSWPVSAFGLPGKSVTKGVLKCKCVGAFALPLSGATWEHSQSGGDAKTPPQSKVK